MTPTAPAAAPTVTARLIEHNGDTAVLGVRGTDYRLHLVTPSPLDAQPGDLVTGTIRVKAKRVDVVGPGGRFIEPVFGRPRRLQGRVTGGDPAGNTLTLQCGAAVVVELMPAQNAGDFAIGQIVGFDAERGATFTPASA